MSRSRTLSITAQVGVGVLLIALSACTSTKSEPPPADVLRGSDALPGDAVLEQLRQDIERLPGVAGVIELDAKNDPHQKHDDPLDYEVAAVIHHSPLRCETPGIECGGVLEVWSTADEAAARAEEQAALAAADISMGAPLSVTNSRAVLFVSADLTREARASLYDAVLSADVEGQTK